MTPAHDKDRPCQCFSPPWFNGRWRDWHRGEGCSLDDGKPRTPEGAAEIAAGMGTELVEPEASDSARGDGENNGGT